MLAEVTKLCIQFLTLYHVYGYTGYVERSRVKADNDTNNGFITLVDKFGNPSSDISFCESRNASCTDETCKQCKCEKQDTFVSYHHGCKSMEITKQLFPNLAQPCFTAPNFSFIPGISMKSLQGCNNILKPPSNILSSRQCDSLNIRKLNLADGTSKEMTDFYFNIKRNGSRCLKKCQDGNCKPIQPGNLFGLNIKCITKGQPPIKSCFLVKIEGKVDVTDLKYKVVEVSPSPTVSTTWTTNSTNGDTSFPTSTSVLATTKDAVGQPENRREWMYIVISIAAVLVAVIAVGISCCLWRRQKKLSGNVVQMSRVEKSVVGNSIDSKDNEDRYLDFEKVKKKVDDDQDVYQDLVHENDNYQENFYTTVNDEHKSGKLRKQSLTSGFQTTVDSTQDAGYNGYEVFYSADD